jgi:2-dehydropantoate 2-reductase
MKVLTIGTGIVGTIYSWVLADAGHDVTHFVRPGKAAGLAKGIDIDLIDRRVRRRQHIVTHYALKATEVISPEDRYDLILVPVKVYQLEPLLRQIGGQTGEADYLILTSLWDSLDALDALIPREQYLLGDALAGGTFRDGKLVAGLRREFPLGEVAQAPTERLKRIASAFAQVGLQPRLYDKMRHYKWIEYATNAGLWPALVRSGSLDCLLRDGPLLREALVCVQECLDVCAHRGVDLSQFPETRIYLKASPVYRFIMPILMAWMIRLSAYHRRTSAHGLSDPVEIRTVYDNVLKTGHKLGLPMPHFSAFEPDIRRFCAMTKPASCATVLSAWPDRSGSKDTPIGNT